MRLVFESGRPIAHVARDLGVHRETLRLWSATPKRMPACRSRQRDTSFRYTQRLADLGIAASVGSVADAYDNAMAESFVATLKTELVQGRVFTTRFEAEIAVVEYLGWFNHTRLHRALGDLPPAEFEALSPTRTETITPQS